MKKIVVDMMGSDLGTQATIGAVLTFHKDHPDYQIFAVGKQEELEPLKEAATIVDARDVVPMTAGALEVLRMKTSSMVVALDTFLAEKADGIISAGATGAFLSAVTLKLKKIPGVLRPALITNFPNLKKGGYVTLLDVGASNENTPEEMAQFAFMGALFAKAVFGLENPEVKLLANGTEEGKGSPEGKEAFKLLSEDKRINFQGNTEGSAVFTDTADVVVTDGFTGNVMLKSSEGAIKAMSGLMKKGFKKNFKRKMGYLLAKGAIKELKAVLDPKNVGGAMLIGVNGVAVKAHGNSTDVSFRSAMEVEYRMIEAGITEKIAQGFKEAEQ